MFGQSSTNQAVMGSPTAQNPSMLDNVTPQDFQQQAPPAQPAQDTPQQAPQPAQQFTQPEPTITYQPFQAQAPVADSQAAPSVVNPFAQQNPLSIPPEPQQDPEPQAAITSPFTTDSPSGPVNPPSLFSASTLDDQVSDSDDVSTAESAQVVSTVDSSSTPVDHQKLADMKQDALTHLEPLTDHLGGTPEETFRATMMMIQANDNHTLLEKALEAAKNIEDDKTRAQAMLDIINEINYFSQTSIEN
jgi:hypothetical protein